MFRDSIKTDGLSVEMLGHDGREEYPVIWIHTFPGQVEKRLSCPVSDRRIYQLLKMSKAHREERTSPGVLCFYVWASGSL